MSFLPTGPLGPFHTSCVRCMFHFTAHNIRLLPWRCTREQCVPKDVCLVWWKIHVQDTQITCAFGLNHLYCWHTFNSDFCSLTNDVNKIWLWSRLGYFSIIFDNHLISYDHSKHTLFWYKGASETVSVLKDDVNCWIYAGLLLVHVWNRPGIWLAGLWGIRYSVWTTIFLII